MRMTDTIALCNKFISTDIICVKFYGSFVLAGVGGHLKVFSLSSNTCVKEVEVFTGHKIYGIVPDSGKRILVYGSKSVKIFTISDFQSEISLSCIALLTLEDWILASHWVSNENEIVLVTAHNVAWLWPWNGSSGSPLKRADCCEKCILYSATVCGDEWSSCVVFAGTVFREVIVWLPGGVEQNDQPVLHRLEGHNGVIFSLTWDWHSSSLCSTSDDRSVRLWSISLPDKSDWKSCNITCSHVFYGHSARVWRSIILDDLIVSVGEDCQICFWSTKGKLLQKLERSTSGCQWTLDYSPNHNLLVTGAGDGSIQLLPLSLPLSAPKILSISCPEPSIQSSFSCVRKIIMLGTGCIVAITEDGTVLNGYQNIPSSWKIVSRDVRFANYCIISTGSDRNRFSLASLKGLVVLYGGTPCDGDFWTLEQQVEEGKIWSVLWLSNEEILVCGDEGRLSVWQVSQNPGMMLICTGRFRLPRARERWPTSATLLTRSGEKFLLCGDRCGSLHLFNLQESSSGECLTPDHSLPKLHGKLGVTSVLELGNQIFSTGRDGTVRTLRVDHKSKNLSVLSTEKMPMEWVCTILCPLPSAKHFLIVGFKETNMIIWSTEERRTIFQLDCGGGHRSYDCIVLEKERIEITFVREKQIFYSSLILHKLMKPTLMRGVSPRELNCVMTSCNFTSTLLFGGEDGTIYVCKFSDNLSSLKSKITLTSHISSVRCMCFYGNLFFSAGGRAQLKAWQIEVGGNREISCIEMASHMLKGERDPRSPPSIDPEMRYMSICSIPGIELSATIVPLVSGYSDGALRWLTFDSSSKSIEVVGESMFHGKCVLKLLAASLSNGRVILVSTATDGKIALWDMVSEIFTTSESARKPFWSSCFHQSGVNSVNIRFLPDSLGDTLLLASGGDDNSVVLSVLHLDGKNTSLAAKWSSSTAHAAQVTGVWLIREWLISTSIDQRLTVWRWVLSQREPAQLECDFVQQIICSVPDIQDMQIWHKENLLCICVVGKGVQILSIPFKNPAM